MNDHVALPEMQEFAEQVGEFIHYWGFKRVHGRIWTHLFLASEPMDAADLVKHMKISKALVSISLRELMEFQVILEAGKSDRGTNLYKTNPDILSVILNVLRQREKRMLSRVQAAFEGLERTRPEDKISAGVSVKQMEHLGRLIHNAASGLDSLIALRSVDFSEWRVFGMAGDEPGAPPVAASGTGTGAPTQFSSVGGSSAQAIVAPSHFPAVAHRDE